MGLFSGGLTFGSFFVYQIVGLIFGWANFRVGLLLGVYGMDKVGVGWDSPRAVPRGAKFVVHERFSRGYLDRVHQIFRPYSHPTPWTA